MRKIVKSRLVIFITVAAVAVSLMAAPAVASAGSKMAELFYRDIRITLNGAEAVARDADGNAVEPFIIDGTTYLPVRGVSSMLGLDVDWDDATSTVKLSSGPPVYYTVRVTEMYDEFFALFNNMYWVLEQMSQLNDRMYYKEDTGNFADIYEMHEEWVADTGHLADLIAGVTDILTDLKSCEADEWIESALTQGKQLLDLTVEIHPLLQNMHEMNGRCYTSGDAYSEFADCYGDVLDMLYELDELSREGQLAANEYLRNNIY